jgi:hypothetical protein
MCITLAGLGRFFARFAAVGTWKVLKETTMKVKQEHYDYIKTAIEGIGLANIVAHREALKDDPRVRDLDMRLRWDCLWSSVPSRWVCDNIYPYANDEHLDTALRRILKEVA